jgi:hypothetical protein
MTKKDQDGNTSKPNGTLETAMFGGRIQIRVFAERTLTGGVWEWSGELKVEKNEM